jgi:hypothetical protein
MKMTREFEYDNLPDEMTMEALPEELFEDAQAAFAEALASREVKVAEAKAGYLYKRKAWLEVDPMGRYRNAYGANDDDIVLQLTIRVRNPKGYGVELPKLAALEEAVIAKEEEAEKVALEAEIAAQEAAAQQAANAAAAAAEKLAKLKEKRAN